MSDLHEPSVLSRKDYAGGSLFALLENMSTTKKQSFIVTIMLLLGYDNRISMSIEKYQLFSSHDMNITKKQFFIVAIMLLLRYDNRISMSIEKYQLFSSHDITMDVKKPSSIHDFGKRLTQLRRARGLTQEELGVKIGVSKRVIAYYEGETTYPPSHLIIPLAKALRLSVDALLGLDKSDLPNTEHASLWRKLKKAEQLSKKDRKALVDYIDALVARTTLRQAG